MEKKTYELVKKCTNCGNKVSKTFPYGQTASRMDDDEPCSYCGCNYWLKWFHPDDPRVK